MNVVLSVGSWLLSIIDRYAATVAQELLPVGTTLKRRHYE